MFDELEKIWIEELFLSKYEEIMQEQRENLEDNFKMDTAKMNDASAIKSAFEKIKKLF